MVIYIKFICDITCQKLLKSATVLRSYSKNNSGPFSETRCTYGGKLSCWNSKRLLRKLEKNCRGRYCFCCICCVLACSISCSCIVLHCMWDMFCVICIIKLHLFSFPRFVALLQSSPYATLLQLSPMLFMLVIWCVTNLLASDPLYSLRSNS